MEYFIIALKIIVGLSLLNVWLIQPQKETKWRGGSATSITEEFKVYGLPVWFCYVIGFLKVSFSLFLLASIYYPSFEFIAAIALASLLSGSVAMHLKIQDPLFKSLPAFSFLVACLIIAFL